MDGLLGNDHDTAPGIVVFARSQRMAGGAVSVRPPSLERGDKTTRVEAFVDAAFAFALTLLAIAGDHVPSSVGTLVQAVKELPAFALSFLLVLQVWSGHVDWSRSYGLDDRTSRRLSLLLVFMVLVFVYPLKMVFGALCSTLTRGWLPANFTVSSVAELPALFIVFGIAFGSLGMVLSALYLHAWRLRELLGLDAAERIRTRARIFHWALVGVVALLSIVSTLLIPARTESGWWLGFPGFVYFSLNITAPLLRRHALRRIARLREA